MMLASLADLRSDLGFDNMNDVNEAITAALDAAEGQLASDLNTTFVKQTFTDTFYIEEPGFCRGPAVSTQLRLSEGFVSQLNSVLLYDILPGSTGAAGSWFDSAYFIVDQQQALASGDQGLDQTAIWSLDPVKGLLKNVTYRYCRQFVVVSYTSGFDPDPSNPDQYLLSEVPQWLQDAAKIRAKIFLADSDVVKETNTAIDAALLGKQIKGSLARNQRYAPSAILPL